MTERYGLPPIAKLIRAVALSLAIRRYTREFAANDPFRAQRRKELLRLLDADLSVPPTGEVWAVHHADLFTDEAAYFRREDALIAWEHQNP